MVNCSFCGKELYMPFTCKYCGNQFCSEHRLPENHKCERMELIEAEKANIEYVPPQPQNPPVQAQAPPDLPEGAEIVEEKYDPETGETMIRYYIPSVRRPDNPILGITSKTELKHLAIGILLMFESVFLMFLLSFLISNANVLAIYPNLYILLLILGVLITGGFIGHELSHKFSSIKLDLWAEFRLTKEYAIMTAIIPYFVMPGAVQVSSSKATEKDMGKIALAGPMFNLVLGVVYLGIAIFIYTMNTMNIMMSRNDTWWIFGFSAFMNVMLGVCNLIPFYVLDGKKIFTWNKKIWILACLSLIGLAAVLFFIPYPGAILGNPPASLYK